MGEKTDTHVFCSDEDAQSMMGMTTASEISQNVWP